MEKLETASKPLARARARGDKRDVGAAPSADLIACEGIQSPPELTSRSPALIKGEKLGLLKLSSFHAIFSSSRNSISKLILSSIKKCNYKIQTNQTSSSLVVRHNYIGIQKSQHCFYTLRLFGIAYGKTVSPVRPKLYLASVHFSTDL